MRGVHGLAVILVAAAACGGRGDDKAKVAIPAEHVAAVNALVPPAWTATLVFEVGTLVDKRGPEVETYRFAKPRGWVPGFLPGSVKPADADDFGRSAQLAANLQMRIGTNCDGECIAKDWDEVADRVYYKTFTSGARKGKVASDTRTKTGRTLVFLREPMKEMQGDVEVTTGERGVNILTTWWKSGGTRMFICEVDLGEQHAAPPPAALETLVPAFEKACSLVSVE
jgi:hypothetical protein